jgi:protein TonB
MVDLAPAPAAQQVQTQDVAPGPEMQQADAPPPEPPKTEMIEQLPPTPPQPEPIVAAPPKVEPKPQPTKPQPVREQVKKQPTKKPPAPRTTAPQKAERVAPDTPAATSGASAAAAAASYRSILVAHLQRFKQFPSGAGPNDSGVAYVRFTVTRGGRVTSSGLSRSSGFSALDRAALDLLQRAQPLPPFPPEMRQASESFTAPLNYVRR